MAKAKLKTEKSDASVKDFINSLENDQRRLDSIVILEMMQKATGEEPKMWGGSIIGFGNVSLKYESGRKFDWFKIGFSPRKQNQALYGLDNVKEQQEILQKLGKYSTGKGCLYINKLEDIDKAILKKIIDLACKRKKVNLRTKPIVKVQVTGSKLDPTTYLIDTIVALNFLLGVDCLLEYF